MLKKSLAFLLIPASLFLSHQAFSAPCSIVDYSADYTINIDCDALVLTEAFANTLTIDANIINTGQVAIDAYSYALEDLIINDLQTISSSKYTIKYNNLEYGSILNNGYIYSALGYAISLTYGARLTTLTNNRSISTLNFNAIYVNGEGSKITTLNNEGIISATGYAISVSGSGEVTTLLNTGTLSASNASYEDIINLGTITNFYNDQGYAASDPVTLWGNLPTNYQIIINSTSDYGQVVFSAASGTTNFGVHSTSSVDTSATYSSVIAGLTSAKLNYTTTGTVTLSGTSYTWTLTDADSDFVWDLNFNLSGPSAADTQTSIQAIKGQLQGNLNSLTAGANFANMNTYDCNFFDSKGGCFSFGSRYTDVQNPSMQTNSFVATGGYKIDNHFRIAGFIDKI